ncbi:MAG TPA: peroxiredoxin, partial [Acidimicrobiales bacterium]|nr:peroxiredoxin [Acidimicrobiales bacterium]
MQKNDVAYDFTLKDQDGNDRTLSQMVKEGPVVLFFYPAAMSPGCTKESCHFRDLETEFESLGAQPVGISMDTSELQAQF